MSGRITLNRDHIERAYAQLRRHDWPSLDQLERCHNLYLAVRGQAVNVAAGRPLPPEPVAKAAPVPQAAAPPTARMRRRDDPPSAPAPFDPRAAAAGEYLHPDEEPS